MAKHDNSISTIITAAQIRERMERRFAYLYDNDRYNGQYAGEFNFLENVLAESFTDEGLDITDDAPFPDHFAMSGDAQGQITGDRLGGCRAESGAVPPGLLTGGGSSTESPETPSLFPDDVQKFSHAGYDGGIMVGIEGTWNPLKFSDLLSQLEEAKKLAQDASKEGLEGFPLNLCGEDVLVFPTGGKAGGSAAKGGLIYPYRFVCCGMEFLIHTSPSASVQPIRIRYLAESVQGHRNRFFEVHFGFVLPFLKKLGLVVHSDKLFRVDMQCLIDVPMSEFLSLLDGGHVVTKLRKKAVYGTMKRVETIELGSVCNAQICVYDKGCELRVKKLNIVKEAQFIRECVGDEWYNSGRPITRVEIRLGRDALKSLGVSSVRDLQERERAIIDLLTSEWFRILAEPKVRGHENSAAIHPIWERVRSLFFQYFTGAEVTDVIWNRRESLECDSDCLFRQALGCLSKAFAYEYGRQSEPELSMYLAKGWVDVVGGELHNKLNLCAELVRVKTGIVLGVSTHDSAGYDAELDYMRERGAHNARAFINSLEGYDDRIDYQQSFIWFWFFVVFIFYELLFALDKHIYSF